MKKTTLFLLPALMAFSVAASADPWKDESGHRKGHEYKEEYWDGNCKVERKLEKSGEYKEERKCRGPKHGHPERVYVPVPQPVVVEPGITIHGTIKIPQ